MSTIVIIAVGIVVLIIGVTAVIYNKLIRSRNRVDQADSDIDVQLKRRWDLIPNLVESVKGYMKHEKETLEAVTEARSNAMNAKPGNPSRQAENILEGALKSLFAVSENYPDLKASENFLQLQGELVDTEDKIQAARRLYNATLRSYIDQTQLFPSNIFANIFGFKVTGEYFEVSDAEAEPVKVGF